MRVKVSVFHISIANVCCYSAYIVVCEPPLIQILVQIPTMYCTSFTHHTPFKYIRTHALRFDVSLFRCVSVPHALIRQVSFSLSCWYWLWRFILRIANVQSMCSEWDWREDTHICSAFKILIAQSNRILLDFLLSSVIQYHYHSTILWQFFDRIEKRPKCQ